MNSELIFEEENDKFKENILFSQREIIDIELNKG